MKKLLILLSLSCVSVFAVSLGGISADDVATGANCTKQCDAGAILKVLNAGEQAKSLSTTTCQVSCANKCFAGKINEKNAAGEAASTSETAAIACQDSLKKDLHIN